MYKLTYIIVNQLCFFDVQQLSRNSKTRPVSFILNTPAHFQNFCKFQANFANTLLCLFSRKRSAIGFAKIINSVHEQPKELSGGTVVSCHIDTKFRKFLHFALLPAGRMARPLPQSKPMFPF